ncbi:MAG: T9SS type A sorting domain-containing protein [Bacteroidales bacterium]|nr:T9SS type A sorting domain-containing protein [Bacteroidales bacterium]
MKRFYILTALVLLSFGVMKSQIVISGNVSNLYCYQDYTGSIDITVAGGTGGYTYNWSGPNGYTSNEEDIYSIAAGTYFVTVSDGVNADAVENYTVTEPFPIEVSSVTLTSPSCPDLSDGSIDITISGGTMPYNYEWHMPDQTYVLEEDLSNIEDGYYYLIINDFNECSFETDFNLVDPDYIYVEAQINDESCSGATDASIDLTIDGGTAPYAILWSNGETSEEIINLTIDPMMGIQEYGVTITDNNNCVYYDYYYLNAGIKVEFDVVTDYASCGSDDGYAEVTNLWTSSGGGAKSTNSNNSIYNILWSNGDIDLNVVENLTSGVHSVVVTDVDYGCSTTKFFNIDDSNDMSIETIITDASCETCGDGQIEVNVSGETSVAPYTILWEDSTITSLKTGLHYGSYSVTISDANGCSKAECLYVGYINELYGYINVDNYISSCGASDATLRAIVYGGVSPYTYLWNDDLNSTTESISNVTAGVYNCTVTDALGFNYTITYGLSDPSSGISVYFNDASDAHCGQADGYINVAVSGGSGTYSFLWSNGSTDEDLYNANPGQYYIVANDGVCSQVSSFYIGQAMQPAPQICIVTVDSASNHNLVVWEHNSSNIDHYNIFRKDCADSFSYIGSVDADSVTVFEDITSMPFLHSYSYQIQSVDECDYTSNYSNTHKTIHLEINVSDVLGSAELIWDNYIGFWYPELKVYKKTIDQGWFELISLSNDVHSFTDPTYDYNTISYAVGVEKDFPCDAWNGNNPAKANGGPYYQSVSNLEDEGIVDHTSVDLVKVNQFSVYPNPTSTILNIENVETISSITVFMVNGQKLVEYVNLNDKHFTINTSSWPKGEYLVVVKSDKEYQQKLIVE